MTERTTFTSSLRPTTTLLILFLTLLLPFPSPPTVHSFLPTPITTPHHTHPIPPSYTTDTLRRRPRCSTPAPSLTALEGDSSGDNGDELAECVRRSSPVASLGDVDADELDFDWREAGDNVFREDARPVVLFDGVCKFCNGSVNYALDNDSVGRLRFASLQSRIGRALLLRSGKDTTDLSSIVVVTSAESLFKSDAALYIASRLDGNAYLPFIGRWSRFVPSGLRNVVYDFVSRNRYRFGESDSCRVDLMEFDDRFVPEP